MCLRKLWLCEQPNNNNNVRIFCKFVFIFLILAGLKYIISARKSEKEKPHTRIHSQCFVKIKRSASRCFCLQVIQSLFNHVQRLYIIFNLIAIPGIVLSEFKALFLALFIYLALITIGHSDIVYIMNRHTFVVHINAVIVHKWMALELDFKGSVIM